MMAFMVAALAARVDALNRELTLSLPPIFEPGTLFPNRARFPAREVISLKDRSRIQARYADLFAFVADLEQRRGRYSDGLTCENPMSGFRVQCIELVPPSDDRKAVHRDQLRTLQRRRQTNLSQILQAEEAVRTSASRARVIRVLKQLFLRGGGIGRESNVVLTFHGTGVGHVDIILETGLLALRGEDEGFFGLGCYTTPSMEYAAQYACGDLVANAERNPYDGPDDRLLGCWPIIMFAAAVGLAYPVVRDDYVDEHGAPRPMSRFYGRPLFNGAVESHVAAVAENDRYQVPHDLDEAEYLELVSHNANSLLPIGVLWVKRTDLDNV
jgi:hypothetical protein